MVEIVNPQDAVRVDLDLKLSRIRNKWLRVCGPCDAGLSGECTHPDEDYRTVIADLVTDLEKFREHAALLSASTMGETFDRLEELVEKEKELATERRQGAAMAYITGEAIRQIGEERDAAREELAKTRAELDRLRIEEEELRVTYNTDSGKRRALQGMVRAVRDLHRRYRGIADVDSCEECSRVSADHVPYPCATRRAVDDPATTAEPAAS